MHRPEWIRSFVTTADVGSFSRAGQRLGLSQPAISKHVACLETAVGHLLIRRTTRSLHLTDVGATYLSKARAMLAAIDDAESTLATHDPMAGTIALTSPPSLANARIVPMLADFLAEHPQTRLDTRFANSRLDIDRDELDLAVRVGALGHQDAEVRLIGRARRVLVASPSYIARHGYPATPQDLSGHGCLRFGLLDDGPYWHFIAAGAVRVDGPLASDSPSALRMAALCGMGIAQSADWLFEQDIAAGKLVTVLPDDPPLPMPIHLMWSARHPLSYRARVLADFLTARFAADPSIAP